MRLRKVALGTIGFGASIALWAVVAIALSSGPRAIPGPLAVAGELGRQVGTGPFWKLIGETVGLWALGMLLVVCVAIPVGIVMGLSDRTYAWTRSTLDALRSLPHVALIPILLIVLGTTTSMVMAMVVLGATWPLLLQTIAGVRAIEPVTKDTARVMHLSGTDKISSVYVPAAMPFIVTGLRVAAALALIIVIVTGMLAGTSGLGLAITQAQEALRTDLLYGYILVVGVLGVTLVGLLSRLENRLLHWQKA